MAAVSSLLNVPFMNPLTLARRFDTSDSMEPPCRRLRRISCCASHVVSRPPTSLLFWNQPAVTVRPRGRQAAVRWTRAREARGRRPAVPRGWARSSSRGGASRSVTRIELPGCHARDGPSHASLISVSDRPHLRLSLTLHNPTTDYSLDSPTYAMRGYAPYRDSAHAFPVDIAPPAPAVTRVPVDAAAPPMFWRIADFVQSDLSTCAVAVGTISNRVSSKSTSNTSGRRSTPASSVRRASSALTATRGRRGWTRHDS